MHYDKHALATWPIGLMTNHNNPSPLKSIQNLPADIKEELNYHLCNVKNQTINGLSSIIREKSKQLDMVTQVNNTVFHLQLVTYCQENKFIFRYDIYEKIKLVGITWDHVTVNCKIPIYEVLTQELFMYICGYVESVGSYFGLYEDGEICIPGSLSCNQQQEYFKRQRG